MKINLKGDEAIIIFGAKGFRCIRPEIVESDHIMLAVQVFEQLTRHFVGETTVLPARTPDGETI